jgi:hypothetical protein
LGTVVLRLFDALAGATNVVDTAGDAAPTAVAFIGVEVGACAVALGLIRPALGCVSVRAAGSERETQEQQRIKGRTMA